MKQFSLSLSLIGATVIFVASPSLASSFLDCDVTVEVISIEELSVFGKGSVSLPSNGQPDSKDVYTFMKLLNLHVTSAVKVGGSSDCKQMLDEDYKVILDSKDVLESTKAGDQLKLNRVYRDGETPWGVRRRETWSLQ